MKIEFEVKEWKSIDIGTYMIDMAEEFLIVMKQSETSVYAGGDEFEVDFEPTKRFIVLPDIAALKEFTD